MLSIQESRRSTRIRPAATQRHNGCRYFLVLMPFFVGGCATITAQLGGLQFDAMVQGNDKRAQGAALAAQQQTCSAAQSYRDASQKAAADSAALATQSSGLASGIRTAIDQRGALMTYVADSKRRIDEAKAAYEAARTRFQSNFSGGDVDGVRNLGNVIADTGAYTQAIIDVARAYATAAMDLDLLAGGMGTQVDKYLPAGVNLTQLATDFSANSKSMLDRAIANAGITYDVPADYANIRVDQIPNTVAITETTSDYFKFRETMRGQYSYGYSIGSGTSPAVGNWAAVQAALGAATGGGGAGGSINAAIASSNDQIAMIADQTQVFSAEAARNAWLAVDACGGTLPADLPPLASPFDNRPELIPSWSSTFWDISSP